MGERAGGMSQENGKPLLALLAGPSGVGKDAVRDALCAQHPGEVHIPLTVTTRKPREDEVHGRDYRFVDDHLFQHMEDGGMFAETALVHGRRYGTPLEELGAGRYAGLVSLLKVDVQGAEQLRRKYPQALGIFLLPESVRQLEERLEARGMDPQERQTRLQNARQEMRSGMTGAFDHWIVNREGRLQETVQAVWTAIEQARMKS